MSAVISVGENTTLSCSAVGFPAPDIVWTRDGVELIGSSELEIMTRTTDPQTTRSFFTVTSLNVHVNLTGIYRCLSITTIEGLPSEIVESNPATITVQGMQYTSCTMDKYSYRSLTLM